MGLRRGLERARTEHYHKIEAQRRPVDVAQIGDDARDLAAKDVEGERVAKAYPQSLGDVGAERDQGRAAIVRGHHKPATMREPRGGYAA